MSRPTLQVAVPPPARKPTLVAMVAPAPVRMPSRLLPGEFVLELPLSLRKAVSR